MVECFIGVVLITFGGSYASYDAKVNAESLVSKKKHNVEVVVKTTIPPMNMWSRGQHHNTPPTNTNNAKKKKMGH